MVLVHLEEGFLFWQVEVQNPSYLVWAQKPFCPFFWTFEKEKFRAHLRWNWLHEMATEHHPVTLRGLILNRYIPNFLVMRLRKPSFGGVNGMVPNTITAFPGDCCSSNQGVQMLSDSGQEGLGMSSLLALPAAFGWVLTNLISWIFSKLFRDIHLGELFRCYITVFNHTSDEVTNVSIQVRLFESLCFPIPIFVLIFDCSSLKSRFSHNIFLF